MNPHPRTVEDVITDFKGRRSAIIKALTKNVDEFHQLCNPNLHSLSLYAFPDQQWKVDSPPPNWDLPEPKLGINLVRDSMTKHQWLSMVALHCDAWLLAIASYYAAKLKFDKADRKRLFNNITDICSVSDAMTSEKRKRERNYIVGGFPEELLVELLSRVPVRDLVRYRLVCKKWRGLIDDPGFVSTQLTNYKSNCDATYLIVIEQHKSWKWEQQVRVRRSDIFRKVMELNNGGDDWLGSGEYRILGYVNGVMLIRKKKTAAIDDIILWNPSINKSLNISNSGFLDLGDGSRFELGLGFDASSNDLKVVAIVYPHVEPWNYRYYGTVPGLVQVYILSTKSWRSCNGVHPPPYWSTGSQVFFNGCIHWTNLGPEIRHGDSWHDTRVSHIVSFDVSNEVFSYFELPSEAVEDLDGEIMVDKLPIVLEGSLGMFYTYEYHYEVWVMEEYGVSNSWNKRYNFELQIDNLLHFKSNGELLFALNGKGIKSYDVKTNSVKDLAKTYSLSMDYSVYAYVESLLLGCK